MLLRAKWMRLRRHWVCAGIGAICLTGLSISGCSRAPMARFKEATTASPSVSTTSTTSATDEESQTETRRASTAAPDPREPVASSGRPEEGRVTIVGDRGGRSGLRPYREGYADLRDRVLRRDTSERGDPFLDADAQRPSQDFPATDELAPRSRAADRPMIDGSVARADLRPGQDDRVGTASHQRPSTTGVARTTPASGVTRTSPGATDLSRLEQLRAELREQSTSPTTNRDVAAMASIPETPRGEVLSAAGTAPEFPGPAEVGVARIRRDAEATTTQSPVRTASAEAQETRPSHEATRATTEPGVAAGVAGESDDLSMRVQSLLATAEWLTQRGELDQAYRNAMLAQHLGEYGRIEYGPEDRRPSDVVRKVWQTMQQSEAGIALSQAIAKPAAVSSTVEGAAPHAVADSRPVPADVFPRNGRFGWERAEGPSTLIPDAGAMPVIAPRGQQPGPALRVPGPKSAGEKSPAELEHVAAADNDSPISLAKIESAPVESAAATPVVSEAVAEARRRRAEARVVTALAEATPAETPAARRRAANTQPTGLTVPAMASLPKSPETLPGNLGPALRGPKLPATPTVEAPPPYLEVMGARQLPQRDVADSSDKSQRRPLLWGLGGMVAMLLGAAYAFRRRWSAGGVAKSADSSSAKS